jgi:thiol-disulfide isomerase/thioredoxin
MSSTEQQTVQSETVRKRKAFLFPAVATLRFLFALTIFVSTCLVASHSATAQVSEGVEWNKDFKKALSLARETGRPVLIDFQADWCKPCKEMEKSFWPRPEVVAVSKKFVCVSLNYDSNRGEASRYGVDRIPAVIFMDAWGNPITLNFGYGPSASGTLLKIMNALPGDFSPISQWNDVLEKDSDNTEALVKVGHFYSKNGIYALSTSFFKRALKSKDIEADSKAREELMIFVGMNSLKIQDFGEAKKSFEDYLKEFPSGSYVETALVGTFSAQLGKKKFGDAEKTLAQLKAAYPNSQALARAEQQLEQAKTKKD